MQSKHTHSPVGYVHQALVRGVAYVLWQQFRVHKGRAAHPALEEVKLGA